MRALFQSFARSERLFVLFAILVGFSISFEYAVTRPASNAIFLTIFSSKALPWVWLATVPLNLCVIFLYSHLLTKTLTIIQGTGKTSPAQPPMRRHRSRRRWRAPVRL